MADIAPISTGSRLVALALTGSRPIAIRIGSDTADPEDAAVFRKPQASPARPANASAQISVSTASSGPLQLKPTFGGTARQAGTLFQGWVR